MRLWHYKLIPVLPKAMLVSQWRECIAIKRQWENETIKHPFIRYVKDYEKSYFINYVNKVIDEMKKRNIKYQEKYYYEIIEFCDNICFTPDFNYLEHNDRYLKQCLYNLQEKYDRKVISEEEWSKLNILMLDVV